MQPQISGFIFSLLAHLCSISAFVIKGFFYNCNGAHSLLTWIILQSENSSLLFSSLPFLLFDRFIHKNNCLNMSLEISCLYTMIMCLVHTVYFRLLGCMKRSWTARCRKHWVLLCGVVRLLTTPALRWNRPNAPSSTGWTLAYQVSMAVRGESRSLHITAASQTRINMPWMWSSFCIIRAGIFVTPS